MWLSEISLFQYIDDAPPSYHQKVPLTMNA